MYTLSVSIASERVSECWEGISPCSGESGGHLPPVPVSVGRNYTLPTTVPATSGTTGRFMIRGIVPLFTSWVSILFDMGASHSFISSALALSLILIINYLDIELHVSTLVGEIVCFNQVCRGCLLSIDDRQ